MDDRQPTYPDELIACIAAGREPTAQELFSLARRVWTDGASERSAFGWDRLPPAHEERLQSLRAAQVALSGTAETAERTAAWSEHCERVGD